jgi:hypothetical protein
LRQCREKQRNIFHDIQLTLPKIWELAILFGFVLDKNYPFSLQPVKTGIQCF